MFNGVAPKTRLDRVRSNLIFTPILRYLLKTMSLEKTKSKIELLVKPELKTFKSNNHNTYKMKI